MIESIPVSRAMQYIEQILHEEHLQSNLLNDFKILINSEIGWNRDDFGIEVIFRNGPHCSFTIYGATGDLEKQLMNGLRTAIITLTRYIPKGYQKQQKEQLYFAPRKRAKIPNSRFRPKTRLKPTWER